MRKLYFIFVGLILVVFFGAGCSRFSAKSELEADTTGDEAVVYGKDSRLEAHYIPSAMVQSLSRLSVALVNQRFLHPLSDRITEVTGDSLQENENLCKNEKFLEQRSSAFCSGILVDASHVLTAGHCVYSETDCANTRFVFGFEYHLGASNNYKIENNNIYSCKKIVAAVKNAESLNGKETNAKGLDFAIVELDRPVPTLFQVTINIEDNLKLGEGVFTIGYPVGVPKKFADGRVSANETNSTYFFASLDTYGGNSGSPVFDASGVLQGILVSGEDDFVNAPGKNCRVSHKCLNGNCAGEEVLKISKIRKYLSELN